MAVSQNDFATEFSNEVESLQPRTSKLLCNVKQKQFDEQFLSELNPTERTVPKNIDVSNLKSWIVNYNVF